MSAGLLQIYAKPSRTWTLTLSYFLFVAGILSYFYVAAQRHRDNPEERVAPTLQQMVQGFYDAALKPAEEDGIWPRTRRSPNGSSAACYGRTPRPPRGASP